MAKPIANTPVLKGKDARDFLENLYTSVVGSKTPQAKKKREEELTRMKTSFDFIQSISK